jgi:hypothetical protein
MLCLISLHIIGFFLLDILEFPPLIEPVSEVELESLYEHFLIELLPKKFKQKESMFVLLRLVLFML